MQCPFSDDGSLVRHSVDCQVHQAPHALLLRLEVPPAAADQVRAEAVHDPQFHDLRDLRRGGPRDDVVQTHQTHVQQVLSKDHDEH